MITIITAPDGQQVRLSTFTPMQSGGGGGLERWPQDGGLYAGRNLAWTALGDSALLDVGTGVGTVAAGDHNHAGVYEPANSNIQLHIADTNNPHGVTKAQVDLGNVSNDAQLKAASNLSDLPNAATARSNLGVFDAGEIPAVKVASTTHTLSASDAGKMIVFNQSGACTLTLDDDFPAERTVTLMNKGAGDINIADGGQTLIGIDTIAGQTLASLYCDETGSFISAGKEP